MKPKDSVTLERGHLSLFRYPTRGKGTYLGRGVERGILALNLTSEGLKYPPEVRVRHETCSTICGTHVQAILDQKNLTGLAGGVREGQNNAFVHISH